MIYVRGISVDQLLRVQREYLLESALIRKVFLRKRPSSWGLKSGGKA